ncbi:CRIB domain-containing protein RIC5-like, partial [Phalaenopsis equestris]|uniref:CRIB domain-containing protein RIC5-like n=1 Tax=Phalaenopsis equestris TaxID=78828 RepID=UPI0009E264C6
MMMNNKMKGLLKGLRYISQIFDEEEKEMQIGYPTDVKHVAHFGCDGPSANAPSWMGEYQLTSECTDGKGLEAPTKELTQLSINSAGSPAKEPLRNSPARRPHRRRSSASDSPLASEANPGRENRRSRRHQSAGSSPSGSHSPAMDSSDGSFRRVRR